MTTIADDEQFFAFCRQNRDLRIEQTREGDWVVMAPTGFETGSRNNEVSRQLGNWSRQDGSGIAFDSSTGYVLPNGAKRSPADSLPDTQAKMQEYQDNGARLGWLIDAAERRLHIYKPGTEPVVQDAPETISGDPELPGFLLDLRWVWEPGF